VCVLMILFLVYFLEDVLLITDHFNCVMDVVLSEQLRCLKYVGILKEEIYKKKWPNEVIWMKNKTKE
jgi:uncharacterized membrane protein